MKKIILLLLLMGSVGWAEGPFRLRNNNIEFNGKHFVHCDKDVEDGCQDFVDAMNAVHEKRIRSLCLDLRSEEACNELAGFAKAYADKHASKYLSSTNDPGSGLTPISHQVKTIDPCDDPKGACPADQPTQIDFFSSSDAVMDQWDQKVNP